MRRHNSIDSFPEQASMPKSRALTVSAVQRELLVLTYLMYSILDLLDFSFDRAQNKFSTLSPGKTAFRHFNFFLGSFFTVLVCFKGIGNFEGLLLLAATIALPLFLYYWFCTKHKQTIEHLNRLLRCIRQVQRVTQKRINLQTPVRLSLLAIVIQIGCFFGPVVRFYKSDPVPTLLLMVFLHPFMRVFAKTQCLCAEFACLSRMILDLNDKLEGFFEELGPFQHGSIIEKNRRVIRAFVETYCVLSKLMVAFTGTLVDYVLVIVGVIAFTVIQSMNFPQTILWAITSAFYLLPSLDLVLAVKWYQRIQLEAARSKTLVENFWIRQDYELRMNMDRIHNQADITEYCLAAHLRRIEAVFRQTGRAVWIVFAWHIGSITTKYKL